MIAQNPRSTLNREHSPIAPLLTVLLSMMGTALFFMVQVRASLGRTAGLELGYYLLVIVPAWLAGLVGSTYAVSCRSRSWLNWTLLLIAIVCPVTVLVGVTRDLATWLTGR